MQCSDESEPLLTLQERSDLINAEFCPPYISCDPKLLSIFVVAFDTRAGTDFQISVHTVIMIGIGIRFVKQLVSL